MLLFKRLILIVKEIELQVADHMENQQISAKKQILK